MNNINTTATIDTSNTPTNSSCNNNKSLSLIKRRSASKGTSAGTKDTTGDDKNDNCSNKNEVRKEQDSDELEEEQKMNRNDYENSGQVGGGGGSGSGSGSGNGNSGGSGSGGSGSGSGCGSPLESNNYYEEDGESDGGELDMDADDDMSEGSFPTNKDLASFAAVNNSTDRPPESVSYLGSTISAAAAGGGREFGINSAFSSNSMMDTGNKNRSSGSGTMMMMMSETKLIVSSGSVSATTGGVIGGGIGGVEMNCNASFSVSQRSLSFSSDNERPVSGGVMMVPSYAASETAKSDIATVCSNSVVEDIDIASVGTAHSATNSNSAGTASAGATATATTTTTNSMIQHSHEPMGGKKKQERGVEFSTDMSTIWKYRHGGSYFNPMRSSTSPMQSSVTSPRTSSLAALNDMGPPLNRSLLERVGGSGPSSTGTPSRAGSVKSFGSQAASDVVHVDTDDCGGSIAVDSDGHISGLDENPSFQSNDNVASTITTKHPGHHLLSSSATSDANNTSQGDVMQNNEIETQNKVVSLDKLCESYPNGRVSPGGTVYKGRGVRKYQGRYMHLPLKRFQQNGAVLPEPINNDQHQQHHEYNMEDDGYQRERRTWQRERSRSRERDIDNNDRWNRSKSPQPSRQMNSNRNNRNGRDRNFRGSGKGGNGRASNGGRWNHGRNNDSSNNQRYKQHNNYNNSSRRGNKNGGSFHMTPRDSRHRDLK